MEIVDDGTLACLNIPRNENSRSFNCDEITQSKLANRTFWVVDYLEDVPTKFSRAKGTKGQTLVQIRLGDSATKGELRKFFTGSADILYICQKLREMDKLPRRVTMMGNGNRYWFE